MLNQLRGRNLAHVGCTTGLTLGLLLGLVLAVITLQLINGPAAIPWATVAWLGLTFALGVFGYIAGARLTRRANR